MFRFKDKVSTVVTNTRHITSDLVHLMKMFHIAEYTSKLLLDLFFNVS